MRQRLVELQHRPYSSASGRLLVNGRTHARRHRVKSLHVVRYRALQWVMAFGWMVMALAAPVQPALAAKSSASVAPSHTVLVMGDSLSAAHGLAESQGWVALIGTTIAASKPG